MKTLILISLAVLTFIVATPRAQALFGHVTAEKDRREHAEQQLTSAQQQLGEQQRLAQEQQRLGCEQQQRANKWQMAAFVLGAASVVMLIAGTAIGSRGRHHAAAGK